MKHLIVKLKNCYVLGFFNFYKTSISLLYYKISKVQKNHKNKNKSNEHF